MYRTNYIIPSDNWEQQREVENLPAPEDYIIPSDNWEQQLVDNETISENDYIIPSDNWEQQQTGSLENYGKIISYQAITGNNNATNVSGVFPEIISYQAITGNNNKGGRQIQNR